MLKQDELPEKLKMQIIGTEISNEDRTLERFKKKKENKMSTSGM